MSKREEFLKKYIDFHTSFGSATDGCRYINNNFEVFAKTHFESKKEELNLFLKKLQEDDPDTWNIVNPMYQWLITGRGAELNISGLSGKALDAWLYLLEDGANYQYSIQFTNELLLVNLITKFNEFLKDTLKIAFSLDHQTKNSWKELSETEQETKVFHLVEDDIKEAAKTIRKLFGLNLKEQSDWREFAEYTYRRHVFIHNRGFLGFFR